MSKPRPIRELSRQIQEEWKTQEARVKVFATAERMWDRLLSPAERRKLGGDLAAAYHRLGTVGMWAKARQTSDEQAVLEGSVGVGHLSQANYEWLQREMGIGPAKSNAEPSSAPPVPAWDKNTGELRYGGKLIRRIRVMAKPSNIQRIVDAFQEEDWLRRIDNPLSGGADQHRLHLTLQSLNQGLEQIRFHGHEGGRAILWAAE